METQLWSRMFFFWGGNKGWWALGKVKRLNLHHVTRLYQDDCCFTASMILDPKPSIQMISLHRDSYCVDNIFLFRSGDVKYLLSTSGTNLLSLV